MYNGFYKIYTKLRPNNTKEERDIVIDTYYNILENIGSSVTVNNKLVNVNINTFLCGYCGQFALYLNRKYGYDIEMIVEKNEEDVTPIHVFNTVIFKGVKYYIDGRGITDNKNLFMSIYSNWDNYDELFILDKTNEKFDTYMHFVNLAFKEDSISNKMISWLLKSFKNNYYFNYLEEADFVTTA